MPAAASDAVLTKPLPATPAPWTSQAADAPKRVPPLARTTAVAAATTLGAATAALAAAPAAAAVGAGALAGGAGGLLADRLIGSRLQHHLFVRVRGRARAGGSVLNVCVPVCL